MGAFKGGALALGMLAAPALAPTSTAWPADVVMQSAAPTPQDETIYRPECPNDEVSSGWLLCRIAGVQGG
jgi:hypothetical protein